MPRSKKIQNQPIVQPLVDDKCNTDKSLLKQLSLEISKLSYEESLQELDHILSMLQNEKLLVEELKLNYLKAILYLEHCEKILGTIEQEVIEIETEDLFLQGK